MGEGVPKKSKESAYVLYGRPLACFLIQGLDHNTTLRLIDSQPFLKWNFEEKLTENVPSLLLTLVGVKNEAVFVKLCCGLLQARGGLNSENFSLWRQSPKKVPNHWLEHYQPKDRMRRIVIWHFFGRLEST